MTEGRATVFVTNLAPDHIYTSIARYGALRPVTSGNFAVFKTARLLEEIVRALAASEQSDYLAFSGSGFVAAMCLVVWLTLHKECNALLYDKSAKGYALRVIKRSEIVMQITKAQDEVEAKQL